MAHWSAVCEGLYQPNPHHMLCTNHVPMVLTKRIIPCLDLKDGRVVKGKQFMDLRDTGDPVELARRYDEQGADEVVFLDIAASKEHRNTTIDVIQRAADEITLPLIVGGGIRSIDDMQRIFRAGADKISINSSAIQNPDLISWGAAEFGSECIVVAMDIRRNYHVESGRAAISLVDGRECWYEVMTRGGSQTTGLDAVVWAQEIDERGAGEILLTSMEADGTREGFDIPITAAVAESVSIPVIASGGVGALEHFYTGFTEGRAAACLAASVFHYGELTIRQVKEYLMERGIPVQL